ncbi:unnamed protein product [Calicophoron daubneyi]|uniref:Uncharacterized protein n=1 Tax=Calicophoron daubneyi TaxID=300641 RepID=A0AAV2TVE8_CALDB
MEQTNYCDFIFPAVVLVPVEMQKLKFLISFFPFLPVYENLYPNEAPVELRRRSELFSSKTEGLPFRQEVPDTSAIENPDLSMSRLVPHKTFLTQLLNRLCKVQDTQDVLHDQNGPPNISSAGDCGNMQSREAKPVKTSSSSTQAVWCNKSFSGQSGVADSAGKTCLAQATSRPSTPAAAELLNFVRSDLQSYYSKISQLVSQLLPAHNQSSTSTEDKSGALTSPDQLSQNMVQYYALYAYAEAAALLSSCS